MLREGYYFPEQRKEEQIIRFIHRRWVSFWPWIIFLSLMILLPIILFFLWGGVISASFGPEDTRYFIVGLSAYYLITLAIFLTSWIGHYLNVVLITPERLIDIRQNGLFNRTVAEQSLLRVQDVSARMDGFFQTFFLYGTLIVETAGESPNFIIPDLPTPNEIANTILKLHEDLIKKSGFDEEDMSSGVGLESQPNLINKHKKSEVSQKKEIESAIDKLYNKFENHTHAVSSLSTSNVSDKTNHEEPILPEKKQVEIFKNPEIKQNVEYNKPEITNSQAIETKIKPEVKKIFKKEPIEDINTKNSADSKNTSLAETHGLVQEGELEEGVQIKL